ncbi:MAG: metabolite traffic protein EboE [Proteobacteria bacterium]|nr:metabolite traffic protein EboE [Pseudomonadota bacterium]
MKIPSTNAHLTYCLNVHPGADMEELHKAVFVHAPRVFARLEAMTGAAGPFGAGLWLSAQNAHALARGNAAGEFAARLADAGMYAFTLNGFPYGPFHGTRVKENVYLPDWSDPRRLDYTRDLARVLARLLPENGFGTISSLPVAYGGNPGSRLLETTAGHLAEAVAFLARLKDETGRRILLCLEPEPDCLLENLATVTAFWDQWMAGDVTTRLARLLETGESRAGEALAGHLGVCLDLVHAGVVFDDPGQFVREMARRGIAVGKVQVGAALAAGAGTDPRELSAFDDAVYLHQTRVQRDGKVFRYPDLSQALDVEKRAGADWRVHFHVPLAWEGTRGLTSTRELAGPGFFAQALEAKIRHFEVETYTLGVFPGRKEEPEAIIARDLAWVMERMEIAGGMQGAR